MNNGDERVAVETRESVIKPFLAGRATSQDKKQRFLWMTSGRLVVATLLLGGTLVIAIDQDADFQGFTSRILLTLILATYVASLLSAIWLRSLGNAALFAATQIGWDLGLTTALIYLTGGFGSGFPFLYGLQILIAAIVVGPRASQITGLASMFIYAAVGYGLATGAIPAPPDQPAARYTAQDTEVVVIALLHLLGLLVVTFLASALSARLSRAGGELLQVTSDAAKLMRLHEDIIRSLTSGLITADELGTVRTINPAGATMLGQYPDALIGRHVSDFLPAPTAEQYDHERRVLRAEGIARRDDGREFPVGYSRSPLLDADGISHGELVLFQDLSEMQKLREAARKAERLAALGRLSAGLAHEIRNPLGSITGSVELIRDSQSLTSEERHLLGIVLSEAERLNALVTTMLELGTPRQPRLQSIDVAALASEVVEIAQRDIGASKVQIVAASEAQHVPAYADPDQVRQVLWNLLRNAMQVAPPQSSVRVKVWKNGNNTSFIEVADEGPGIPAANRERLYDMFFTGRAQGVGLGLALVRQIVDAHGGTIDVDSEEGRGAKFTVSLPASPPAAP